MDIMAMALNSLSMASSVAASEYSFGIANMAMKDDVQSAQSMLEMLPQTRSIQVRGPQPGDVPAIKKGSHFDVYA